MSDTISVNGETRSLSSATVAELLAGEGIDAGSGGVAVARNGEVVPHGDWSRITLEPDDKIEIVHIVRGG
jgi:thiamine biosynthesis protein ThiS